MVQEAGMATLEAGPMMVYDVNYGSGPPKLRTKTNTEYERSVEVSKTPDTFPCGHVLCHNCVRQYVSPYRRRSGMCCPVCDKEVLNIHIHVPDNGPPSPNTYDGAHDDVDNITLLSNFEDVVKRFNGINFNLKRLKEEAVSTRSVGLTYTTCECHMCDENHGTLKVVQEYNRLAVNHVRPSVRDPYFYRLMTGNIVTSFFSSVNSSCVCVPCTYKELRDSHEFPALPYISDMQISRQSKPSEAIAEIGKIITKDISPAKCLQGKNVIEIDHKVKLKERADLFDFRDTTSQIKKMVRQQEDSLIRTATKQIRDTGRLFHIQESSEIECDMGATPIW